MVKQVTQIVLDREDFRAELNAQENRLFERLLAAIGSHKAAPSYRTRKAAAQILGVTLPTLDAWVRQGKIEACRISGRVLFTDQAIDSAVQKIRTTIRAAA